MKYHIEFDIDFKRNPYKGIYIAIEGIDGSGKTTQIEKLFEYFNQQRGKVVKTREPRKDKESLIGELIQKILHGNTEIPPIAFQYLFSADREIHHQEKIIPSLKAGKIVLSDRCFWSAVPYGIADRGGTLSENNAQFMLVAQSILSMYHQFIVPDYTIYLDIPLAAAVSRLNKEKGQKEIYEDKKILEKILKGYKWLLKRFSKEFIVIDAKKPVTKVTEEIIKTISK